MAGAGVNSLSITVVRTYLSLTQIKLNFHIWCVVVSRLLSTVLMCSFSSRLEGYLRIPDLPVECNAAEDAQLE
jgi:hypothetical protein